MGALYDSLEAKYKVSEGQKIRNDAQKATSTLAPYATQYTPLDNQGSYQTQKKYVAPSSNNPINKFTDFATTFGGQVIDLAGDAASWVWEETKKAAVAPINLIASPLEAMEVRMKVDANQKRLDAYNDKLETLSEAFHSGKITSEVYKKSLVELSKENEEILKTSQDLTKEVEKNVTETVDDAINTVLDVVTIASAFGSGGLSTIITPLSKSTSVASVVPMMNFFGKNVQLSKELAAAATKIDEIMIATSKIVNKIGTFNGRLPAGQMMRIIDSSMVQGATNLTAKQIAKNMTVEILLKRPLIYQTNVGIATDIYKQLLNNNLEGAVLSTIATGAMTLTSGPIGLAMEMIGKGFKQLKTLSYYSKSNVSRNSFFDALGSLVGNKDKTQFTRAFAEMADKDAVRFANVMADVNMNMAAGDSMSAAYLVVDWYKRTASGRAIIESGDAKKIIEDLVNYAKNREDLITDAIKNGLSKDLAKRLVLGRANKADKEYIVKFLSEVDKSFFKKIKAKDITAADLAKLKEQRLAMLTKVIDSDCGSSAWAASEKFIWEIEDAIKFSDTTEAMTKRINKIQTGKMYKGKLSKKFRDSLTENGYLPLMPKDTYTPYVSPSDVSSKISTEFAKSADIIGEGPDLFEQAVKPIPILSSIVGVLTKAGLSPQNSQEAVYRVFQDKFDDLIKDSDVVGTIIGKRTMRDGKDIMTKLYSYIRKYNAKQGLTTFPITDIRQITKKEIMEALKVSEKQAKQVMRALNTSMLSVPLELRGLGDKLQDLNIKINPFAAGYARIQGTLKYSVNPFFKLQQATQTEYFAQVEAGTKALQVPGWNTLNKYIFGREMMKQNDEVVAMLQKRNIFAQGFTGEGFSGDVFSQLGPRITKSEKISLAGLVQKQASKLGYTDIGKYIDENYMNVMDTMRTITFSHNTKDFFDSPLARTINTVFFPFRFNIKVANVMAKQMSKLSGPTQVALLYNLYNADQWLNSDEGLAWQSEYAEAIAMFKWITPTYPLSYVAKLAKDVIDPEDACFCTSPANGVITSSAPYINPKTGDVFPRYAPKNTAGQVNLAMQAFIGSLFSYPGAVFGLPSKGSLVRSTTETLVGGQYDFEKISREEDLTPEQKRQQAAIKKANGVQTVEPTNTTKPIINTSVKLPATGTPKADQTTIDRKMPKATVRRKKKSEYIPRPI